VPKKLDCCDFSSESLPHASLSTFLIKKEPAQYQFKSDNAGPDDNELLRHLLQLKGARRLHYRLLVDGDAGEGRHFGSRRGEDVTRVHRLDAAVSLLDRNLQSVLLNRLETVSKSSLLHIRES